MYGAAHHVPVCDVVQCVVQGNGPNKYICIYIYIKIYKRPMFIWVAHDFVSMILIEESENTNVEIGKEVTAQHNIARYAHVLHCNIGRL